MILRDMDTNAAGWPPVNEDRTITLVNATHARRQRKCQQGGKPNGLSRIRVKRRSVGGRRGPQPLPETRAAPISGLRAVPAFATRPDRLAYYERHRLDSEQALLDYNDARAGRETPNERRTREAAENAGLPGRAYPPPPG